LTCPAEQTANGAGAASVLEAVHFLPKRARFTPNSRARIALESGSDENPIAGGSLASADGAPTWEAGEIAVFSLAFAGDLGRPS
jgi:hypothetical protein